MKNREVYEKDPARNKLLNQGVAKVASNLSASELDTLRFELANFVCDGQYAQGLARTLGAYLSNLDKSEQPGVWVAAASPQPSGSTSSCGASAWSRRS